MEVAGRAMSVEAKVLALCVIVVLSLPYHHFLVLLYWSGQLRCLV